MKNQAVEDVQSFDEVYDNINSLYVRAENLLEIVKAAEPALQESLFALIEPLIAEIEQATNAVAEDFADTVEKGVLPTNAVKLRVNKNLRNILEKIEEYRGIIKQIEADDE